MNTTNTDRAANGRRCTIQLYFLVALAAGVAAVAVATDARAAEARRPNIVLMFADDLGYGDLGCFGAQGFTTPNLDRMARQGCRFTNFHVAEPVCSASRAALLTGCYPNRIGIYGALGPSARHGIHARETTLAELLKPLGYATGMAGKWHLGHHPQFLPVHHGFDEYFGLPYSNDMWPYHPEAKAGTFPPLPLFEDDRVIDPEVTPLDQPTLTGRYTQRAVSFIERHENEPFFFYLAYTMPHVPLFPSEAFRGKSEQGTFGDVVQEIDWSVGQVLAALDRHGLADNTLVIFTSDNGPWLSYGNHAGTAGGLREQSHQTGIVGHGRKPDLGKRRGQRGEAGGVGPHLRKRQQDIAAIRAGDHFRFGNRRTLELVDARLELHLHQLRHLVRLDVRPQVLRPAGILDHPPQVLAHPLGIHQQRRRGNLANVVDFVP